MWMGQVVIRHVTGYKHNVTEKITRLTGDQHSSYLFYAPSPLTAFVS